MELIILGIYIAVFIAAPLCIWIAILTSQSGRRSRAVSDEVTHGQFFGENISRAVSTLSGKTGTLKPMETIQISEDVTLQFNNTPAPVVIESAGNEVQLTWEELQRVYQASAEHFNKRPARIES